MWVGGRVDQLVSFHHLKKGIERLQIVKPPVTSFKYNASQSTHPWVIWHLNACGSSHKFLFNIRWSGDDPNKWPLSSLSFVQLRRFIKNGLHWKTNWNNFVQSLYCDPPTHKIQVTVGDLFCQDLSFECFNATTCHRCLKLCQKLWAAECNQYHLFSCASRVCFYYGRKNATDCHT